MQPDLRKALLDPAQHAFEIIDLQIRVQSALHQDAGASHFEGFGDLGINCLEIEDVSFLGLWSLERAVKAQTEQYSVQYWCS